MVVWNKINKTKESDKLSKDSSAFILRNKATTSSAFQGVAFIFQNTFQTGCP